jgi:hypothetical protein
MEPDMRTQHEDKSMSQPPASESELAKAEREHALATQHLEDVKTEELRRALAYLPKGTASVAFSEGTNPWVRIQAAEEQVVSARERLNALLVEEERSRRTVENAEEATRRAERMALRVRRGHEDE